MKIVMFSINPLFPKVVTGGASKHLYHIASHLGKVGHHVEILCAKTDKSQPLFKWSENVWVYPILPFNLPFPLPYDTGGPDLSLIIERVSKSLQNADRFYIHDGEFLIPDVYQHIPTIVSFRDNIYPESVMGSFISKPDEVICVSEYSEVVIKHTAGRFYPDLNNRIQQVNNGIDFDRFKPVDIHQLAQELGLNPEKERILLHPHRPEPGKGLLETIRVVDRLVHHYGLNHVKVLIPEWLGSMVSTGDRKFYDTMVGTMLELKVRDHFQFVPWLPINRMPEYYSLGEVTLCLGNIVEAFGNVAYESLACGTPSIVARVGVHRTLLQESIINKVHFGDIVDSADQIMAILSENRRVTPDALTTLKTKMDFKYQVEQYAQIILSCRKRDQLQFNIHNHHEKEGFIIAPWCYLDGERIYHDFQGRFVPAALLNNIFAERTKITKEDAMLIGITQATWEMWVNKTWIIPET